MKNANIWTFLILPIICISILIGSFIGRISAGDSIQLENPFATLQVDNNRQTDDGPVSSTVTKIDINTADQEMLAKVPGIDVELARKIINFRNTYGPFSHIEDLLRITGINRQKLNDIALYITVGGKK